MKTSRSLFVMAAFIWALGLSFVHAQEFSKAVQGIVEGTIEAPILTGADLWSMSTEDMSVLLTLLEAIPPVPATELPKGGMVGTFFSIQNPSWPPLPGNVNKLSVWPLQKDSYLLDDRSFIYGAAKEGKAGPAGMMQMSGLGPPGFDEIGTNWAGGGGSAPSSLQIFTNGLWLEITSANSNLASLKLHGTEADILYETFSREDLLREMWLSEGTILGAAGQDWTPVAVTVGSRTNNFFWARSWVDSDGSGMPDWWQLQYFGQLGVDPYADPDGDGWNNLQEFQNGTNPNEFNTPPVPQGLTVKFNRTNGTVAVSWNHSAGTVTGYTVERYIYDYASTNDLIYTLTNLNFSADTNGFIDQPTIPAPVPEYGPVLYVAYLVQAHYSGGDSPWSETVWLDDPRRSVSANIVRGPQGRTYLILSTIPESTVALRLSRVDTHVYPNVVTNFDIAIANVTNGVYQLPESWSPPLGKAYQWFIQTVDVNDQFSDAIGPQFNEPIPFFDGRQQLKQNLIFQLRSAGLEESFGYRSIGDPETYFWEWRFSYPTDYAYASFYELDDYYGYPDAYQREFLPFRENYIYRNFAFNTTNMTDSGWLDTGVAWEMVSGYFSGLKLVYPPSYEFQTPTDENAITALLSPSESQWICWPYFYPASAYTDFWQAIGIGLQNSNFVMTAGARNIFGLPYVSAKLAYPSGGSVAFATLEAGGGSLTAHTGYFYPATAQPEFQTVGYYFGQPTLDWLPGHNGFSPTNTTPLMITSVGGRGLWIAGYAKLAVINGYNGVYAYLGQYFDKAYLCDANGQVTTNETGILSPYGEFLPTMPGTVAMVTMPENADNTGPRGTNIVHVIKLQLDVNHDGQMDLSLAGQDDTSAGRPFTFWVNNDHDEPANYNQPDRDLPVSKSKPDYNYGEIRCQRNLEDFARLWIVGLPPIPGFSGYEVTLSWRNTNGAPAINLYGAFDGGTGYLTDTNTAATQIILAGDKLGTVNSTPLTLSDLYFSPASDKYGFLFEGTNTGSGELVMTFSKNGQALAETSQWIDLHDVKDFYERAVITNNISSSAISNWTSGVEIVQPATASALGDDKDIIVLVHGINVDDNAWLIESDTVFKRLYWAGYHGKFATVKWPCNFLTPPQPVTFDVFNLSEAKAYKSSQALTNYLNQLHARFPDHRLHLLLHSQGNAVVSEALARSGVPVDTYILTQGAIVASAYDVNASIYQPFVDKEVGLGITPEWQPWGYRGIYTNLTGRIVNFYNPQDGVLAIWKIDQIDDKPGKYTYDGTNCWYVDFFFIKHLVTDQQEARAMVARARTLSIGQSGPESAHGVIQSAVDLNVQFGFNSDVSEHSAQWTRPIQTSWGYYDEILGACLIPTIQR